MLPLIVDENKILIFKFWFEGDIQDGMAYRGELFCRLQTFALAYRPQVYQFGCRLIRQGISAALTSGDESCSLWVSLRDPQIKVMLSEAKAGGLCNLPLPATLPSVSHLEPPAH